MNRQMIAISHLLNQSSSCFFHPDLKESANSPQLKHQNMFRLRALAFQRRSSSTQVKLIFPPVSCPTISSLYLYFGFCNDHLSHNPDNKETWYSNVLYSVNIIHPCTEFTGNMLTGLLYSLTCEDNPMLEMVECFINEFSYSW